MPGGGGGGGVCAEGGGGLLVAPFSELSSVGGTVGGVLRMLNQNRHY